MNEAGENMQGQKVSEANMQGQNVSEANMQGQNISEENVQARNLLGANLSEQNMSGANLQGQNTSGTIIQGQNVPGPGGMKNNLQGGGPEPVYMAQLIGACEREIQKGIIGQGAVIRQVMLAMLTGGNVLLEGMPGLGKTRLVSTISRVFDLSFKRIQFTPDLMPSDVTGTNIIVKNEQGSSFSFERGPIFANLILADEINRATPKTQSALLEAMQEHTVTVGNDSHKLSEPFFVLATQNPIENEGTYPLPEAQLDRFMFKIMVPFPSKEELKGIVTLTEGAQAPTIEKRIDGSGLLAARALVNQIPIADAVMDYLLDIVMDTHAANPYIKEGASPRAAQALIRGAKANAFLEGRFNVSFQDVDWVAYPVLRHRIILSFDAISEGVSEDMVIQRILRARKAAGH